MFHHQGTDNMSKRRTGRSTVTQKDVARHAGVTQATVSLVINNSPRINPATKKRVHQAIKELGYSTNLAARSLVTRNTHVLSLVTPSLHQDGEHFMMPLLQGVLRGLDSEDYILNYSQGPTSRSTLETVQRELQKNRSAGLLIVSPHKEETSYLNYLLEEKFPFVVLNRRPENVEVPCVAVDYADIAYRAVRYLYRKGHRRIAFINGPMDRPTSQERLRGVRMAFLELGLTGSEEELIFHGDFQIDGGYRGMQKFLGLARRPTAVFAGNDFQAVGAIQALQEAGLKAPDDMAVMGCDDWQMSSWMRPALTTVRVPFLQMGELGTHLLCRLVRREEVSSRQIFLPSEIVERESA